MVKPLEKNRERFQPGKPHFPVSCAEALEVIGNPTKNTPEEIGLAFFHVGICSECAKKIAEAELSPSGV